MPRWTAPGCLIALLLVAPAAHAARPIPCADGRFVVQEAPLLDALAVPVDVVVVHAPEVSIDSSGCQAARARVKAHRRGTQVVVRWPRGCPGRGRLRLRARFAANCNTLTGTVRRRGTARRSFTATRSACGDGLRDAGSGEACDDGNTTACDGCAADCSNTDRCVEGNECSAYTPPSHEDVPPCGGVDAAAPDVLVSCARGSGHLGRWSADVDGLPAYDFDVDERCDPAALAYSPRSRPLRDPIHALGNGRGLMAMAHASGAVELYTQDRGHKWVNKVDTWADPEHPEFPPQVGGGFGYLTVDDRVESTRFEDLPVGSAHRRQQRRFGVGYFETTTSTPSGFLVRRRVLAPDAAARALVVEVSVTNGGDQARDVGLVELWDVNLHQVAVELLTSDLLQPGVTDGIERRRRELAAQFTQTLRWDAASRVATVETTAKALPAGVAARLDPSTVDWFPEPVYLAVLDDGVTPDRVWLTDAELWPAGDRTPPASAAAAGDGAPSRTLAQDGAGQRGLLALRVPLSLAPGATAVRRFAFGMVPGGGAPDDDVAALRAAAPVLAAQTAASWRDRLVWAAFPGLPDAAVVQREIAWSTYAAIASTSYDEYRARRVLGQGGAYRFIHGLDGAMGDLALFAESMLLVDAGIARDTLAYAFSTQHAGNQATPWRFPYATTGVGTYSDVVIYNQRSDAYWFLPSIVGKYVGLTRDAGFLSTNVGYWPRAEGTQGSVLHHIAGALDYAEGTLGYGARGLPAMGTNDYADGVLALAGTATVTPSGTSSTYNAGMIAYGFPLLADVVEPLSATLAPRIRAIRTTQATRLLSDASAGEYFWRGFVDNGDPLAPHIFFLEPQVFPILSGLLAPANDHALLAVVARRLETPIGALSNVAVGTGGPIGGIDQPLVGGIWPVANAWLTAAYARDDAAAGWSSFVRNTLAAHAEAYPDLWYGIWTGPDSFNGPAKPRPGEADAHIATALTDYPALNAHVHTGPLRALTDLVGVAGTVDGIRIIPRLPSETFHVRWPRLTVRSTPALIEGRLTVEATGPVTLEVLLPSGLRGAAPAVTVDGAAVSSTVTDGVVRFVVAATPGLANAWRVEPAP